MGRNLLRIMPIIAALFLGRAALADDPQRLIDRALQTAEEMRHDPTFNAAATLRRARAVLIVPELSKGGFLIGGQGGSGVLLAKQPNGGWGSPAFYSLGGATLGLQAGFQTAKIVFFVMSNATLQSLLRGQFKVGAQDGGGVFVEGTEHSNGRTGQGSDVVAWVHANGAYGGITVEGTNVSFNLDESRSYYRRTLNAEEIVVLGAAANPGADALRRVLAR